MTYKDETSRFNYLLHYESYGDTPSWLQADPDYQDRLAQAASYLASRLEDRVATLRRSSLNDSDTDAVLLEIRRQIGEASALGEMVEVSRLSELFLSLVEAAASRHR